MISWIQRTFQQHMRWIFAALLLATIISFIGIYNPASGIGNSDNVVGQRQFFNIDLASASDQSRLINDAALSVQLQFGFMGLDQDQLQDYALHRVAALHFADAYRLRDPGTEEFTAFLKTLGAFMGADGQFDSLAYSNFRTSLRTNTTVTEAEISRIISEDWRIEQIHRLLGGPGYVQENEIRDLLTQTDTTWTIELAVADYDAFSPTIQPTEPELTAYFESNQFRYEIPPQVRAGYVAFTAADRLSRVEPTAEQVRAYYDANPSLFPKPQVAADSNAPNLAGSAPDSPDADFAAVEPAVRAAVKTDLARRLAVRDASTFAVALYDNRVSRDTIDSFLASRNLERKELAPFTQSAGPSELGSGATIGAAAFQLSAEKFYSDAIPVSDGAVVLIWEEYIPVRQPGYIEVRDKVLSDYRDAEKRKRFTEQGQTLRTAVQQGLAAGGGFTETAQAAATAAGLTVEFRTVAPFALKAPPTDVDSSVFSTLDQLQAGQVSSMIVAGNKGYLVHVLGKQLPDLSPESAAYEDAKDSLSRSLSGYSSNSLMAEFVNEELAKTEPVADASTTPQP